MVELNQFAVRVLDTKSNLAYVTKVRGDCHYIEVPHEETYSIELKSNRPNRSDATISVDGSSIGTFRLEPYGRFNIERPGGVNKSFIFTHEDKIKTDKDLIGKKDNGLITVDFIAEKPRPITRISAGSRSFGEYKMQCSSDTSSASSGFTMLGDQTKQLFRSTDALNETDESSKTRITMRLIGGPERIALQKQKGLDASNEMSIPPRVDTIRA